MSWTPQNLKSDLSSCPCLMAVLLWTDCLTSLSFICKLKLMSPAFDLKYQGPLQMEFLCAAPDQACFLLFSSWRFSHMHLKPTSSKAKYHFCL